MAESNFLQKILGYKQKVIAEKRPLYDLWKKKLGEETYSRYRLFEKQINVPGEIRLIAEIKKASPSKGMIRSDFDLLKIAKAYEDNGAHAFSVLTEDKYFLGRPEYIKKVSDEYHLPVLAKDFFLDEGQIYEARMNGASAILLIMAILDDAKASHLRDVAESLDLDCLVEIHSQEELDRALKLDAKIIGINNRDLQTFDVDIKQSETLIPKIPKDKVIVAESGISSREEIVKLKELGANAVLIGETFMRESDIGAKIKDVMG